MNFEELLQRDNKPLRPVRAALIGVGQFGHTLFAQALVARPNELADILVPRDAGGLLSGTKRLDIFNCFRRSDEISFAGGVFAVLRVPDASTGELFRAKGIPTSADRRHVLVYNPTHLLGVEAPLSILVAQRLGMATGSSAPRPVCDVAMRATQEPGSRTKDITIE